MIEALSVVNYKSLKDVRLERLPQLVTVVGPNASGKSNLLDAIDFLAQLLRDGMDAALGSRGGYENIAARRTRRARGPIEFTITYRMRRHRRLMPRSLSEGAMQGRLWRYHLAFSASGRSIDADVSVANEYLEVSRTEAGDFDRLYERNGDSLSIFDETLNRWLGFGIRDSQSDVAQYFPTSEPIAAYIRRPDIRALIEEISSYRVYQISPQMARRPSAPTSDPTVGRYGQNLASALRRISRQQEMLDELVDHIREAVPSIESVNADYVDTKELGVFFREQGFPRRWFADDVSDGTIQTTALFLTMLAGGPGVLVEEPETSLHPWIVRHFMEIAQEVSIETPSVEGTQVFITTHSPVCVDHTPLGGLFIANRIEGESSFVKVTDVVDDYHSFVRYLNEDVLGLGSLWDRGLFGGVPV